MDLQARIRVRPGGARTEQLRHPRLDIAALAAVLRARRGVAQFARHHEIDEAHRQLVGDARKMNDRLAELLAGERIIEPELDRAAGDPDGARGGLNPRALEGAHQLLEPLSDRKSTRLNSSH